MTSRPPELRLYRPQTWGSILQGVFVRIGAENGLTVIWNHSPTPPLASNGESAFRTAAKTRDLLAHGQKHGLKTPHLEAALVNLSIYQNRRARTYADLQRGFKQQRLQLG